MSNKVFIVGTGRCGSTLLSNMLNINKNVLSISEFFTAVTDLGTLMDRCFTKEELTAAEFWNLLCSPPKKQNLMIRKGIAAKEILYRPNQSSHFSMEDGVPAIMLTTLPHLTEYPEKLFHELGPYILGLPNAKISSFYCLCFDWLKEKLNKKVWVERSGGSLRGIKQIYDTFPDAKFIHIVREGQNCSISMEKHYAFRMVMVTFQLMEILGVDPYEDENRQWVDDLFDDIADFLPENFDADKFRDFRLSPSLYGYYWSGEIAEGMKTFDKIPIDQKMTIKYEDILDSPHNSVEQIASFVGNEYCDEEWVRQAASMVRKPNSNHKLLSDKEQKLLNQSCAMGYEALSKHGVSY